MAKLDFKFDVGQEIIIISFVNTNGKILAIGNDKVQNIYLVKFHNGSRWFAEKKLMALETKEATKKNKAE